MQIKNHTRPASKKHKTNKKATTKKAHTLSKRSFKTTAAARHIGAQLQYHRAHQFEGTAKSNDQYSFEVYPPKPFWDQDTLPEITTVNKREHGSHSIGDRKSTVTIFKPCKNAMANEKNDRWGWVIREDRGFGSVVNQYTNGDDYVQSTEFYPVFHTLNEAIEWCQFEGIKYNVEEEPVRKYDLRSYADNFKWKGPAAAV